MNRRIPLPPPVARIYEAVAELEATYPGRKFTPEGHLVSSIGEVIAAEALGLTLHPASHPGHDAFDDQGDVQIKMTGRTGKGVALYATCTHLVVLKVFRLMRQRQSTMDRVSRPGPRLVAWARTANAQ